MEERTVRRDQVQLARELLAGDAGAFDAFVELFRNKIFQYSYLMCGQREDAEEVSQDTLISVFKNFDQLRKPEHVTSWIFRIARNACLMKRRKSIFAPTEEVSLDEMAENHSGESAHARLELRDSSELPDQQVQRGEIRAAIEAAIRRLPPQQRAVVLLRDIEELSTEDTAEILDVGTDVVKTRLHRARLALRRELNTRFAPPVHTTATPRALPDGIRAELKTAYLNGRAGIHSR